MRMCRSCLNSSVEMGRGIEAAAKITIPSDHRLPLRALSVNVRNPCELPSPEIRRPLVCETLAGPGHHTEVSRLINAPCGAPTLRELKDFNFNLSGSRPIVANRAGQILSQENFLSRKKCVHDENSL
jgi:hypothetical protein